MKRYISVSLSILVLAGVTMGAALWSRAFYVSLRDYRSPLQSVTLSPQSPLGPKNIKIVLVLVSGLGYNASLALNLPVFEQLKQAGATVTIQSIPPTYSQTAWATLITGAPPETNGSPPIDLPVEDLRPLEVDTIFAQAHQANLQTALLGDVNWQRLIPHDHLDYTFFVEQQGTEADEAVLEAALPLIENDKIRLMLIQFTQVDFVGQYQGGSTGEAYREAALRIDEYLGQISQTLDLSRSVLVILADHGHIANGGHGGAEEEVSLQPLVMLGETINAGSYSNIYQTDIAPTISTLLGSAIPTAAQGRILFEMLRLNQHDQATAQLALARQRLNLAAAYLTEVKSPETVLPETLTTDLAQAQSAFITNNISGAFQLALLAQQEADNQMIMARNSRLLSEQLPRLIIALIIILIWFTTMWRRRGAHAGSIIIIAIVTVVLHHALYRLQGYSYSISALSDFSAWPIDIARRTTVSLLVGGGLLLVLLMLTNEKNWLILLGTGYGFGVLVTFIFALPLFWAYWQNGLVADWRLPAVGPAFWQITGLLEVMIAAILGILLPWPIMMLSLFVNVVRHYLNRTRAQAESDALPGLHL